MLKQRLDQRQVQKLILAPALQQAIKLLPLTNLELIEVIDEELSENPMIELEEEDLETGEGQKETSGAGAEAEQEAKPPEEPRTGACRRDLEPSARPRSPRSGARRSGRRSQLPGLSGRRVPSQFLRKAGSHFPRKHAVQKPVPLGPSELAGRA